MKNYLKNIRKQHYLGMLLLLTTVLFITTTLPTFAAEQKKPDYLIKVNRYYNTITIYSPDEKGEYSIPVKAMVCSVGADYKTVPGTFRTSMKYRWKELMGKVYGQYSTRIVGGILFHSVYYYQNGNPASLAVSEYNKLGNAASHGCIRLSVVDAKWIYDNCQIGTTVIIYDDKSSPGPLGKPEATKITSKLRWDPTDPDPSNPYLTGELVTKETPLPKATVLPKIEGVKDQEIDWGKEINLADGVKAVSSQGKNITDRLEIDGEVNCYIPGDYKIAYSVVDELDRLKMKVITIRVKECPEAPVILGVTDRTEDKEVQLTRSYALKGISAYCNNVPLDQSLIKVKIEQQDSKNYYITYELTLGEYSATAHATVTIREDAEPDSKS